MSECYLLVSLKANSCLIMLIIIFFSSSVLFFINVAKKKVAELKHTLKKIEKYMSNAPEGGLKIQNRCGKTYYCHQYKNIETGLYVKT